MTSERYNEANLPPESAPWGRDVDDSIRQLRQNQDQLLQTLENGLQANQSTLKAGLANNLQAIEANIATVARIPVVGSFNVTNFNIGLVAGWQTYANGNLTLPTGKKRVVLTAFGAVAVLDMTSGGLTSLETRLVVNGVGSQAFPAAKDAGASVVNNIGNSSFSREFDVTGTTVPVALQIRPLNPSAFPAGADNFASLTVFGVFN